MSAPLNNHKEIPDEILAEKLVLEAKFAAQWAEFQQAQAKKVWQEHEERELAAAKAKARESCDVWFILYDGKI